MQRNGWKFSSTMQHRPNKQNGEQVHRNCNSRNTWYGGAKGCRAFVSATFRGSGKAILRYENCNKHDNVNVLQSDDIINGGISDTANAKNGWIRTYLFKFSPNKSIRLTSDCNSVIKIISLKLACKY